MSTNEILNTAEEANVSAVDVVRGLKAAEEAMTNYPTLCANTVVIAAAIMARKTTAADIAKEAGVSAMQVGRYNAAGRILLAHDGLDAVAVVAYANDHTKADCKAVEAMTAEEAEATITPKKGRGGNPDGRKTEAEKDLAAVEAFLKRIRKAGESGDVARVEALDNALTAMAEAIAEGYAQAETVAQALAG